MTYPALYRRRLIPDECILLKDDIVLEWNEDRIVTSWKALHPKKDLHHGSSCYFLKEGFKVSEFLAEDAVSFTGTAILSPMTLIKLRIP